MTFVAQSTFPEVISGPQRTRSRRTIPLLPEILRFTVRMTSIVLFLALHQALTNIDRLPRGLAYLQMYAVPHHAPCDQIIFEHFSVDQSCPVEVPTDSTLLNLTLASNTSPLFIAGGSRYSVAMSAHITVLMPRCAVSKKAVFVPTLLHWKTKLLSTER